MTTNLTLPLSLNSVRNFQAFFKAIEDKPVQDALLKDTATDQAVRQIIQLARDKKFLKQAETLVGLMRSQSDANRQWPGSFAELKSIKSKTSPEAITQGASQIREYVQKTYPDGVKLLAEYGKLAQPSHLVADDMVGAWTNVAAYAEALVNGAVYANVAIATNVVVALAAAAVVGAAVMVP